MHRSRVDGSAAVERFLQTHGRLLSTLPTWRVLVAHPQQANSTAVEEAFRRFVGDDPELSTARLQDLERDFVARRAIERHEFGQLSIAYRQRFRSTRLAFAEPRIEALFSRWVASSAPRLDGYLITRPLPGDA
jgi:hypothetical protein